MQLSGKKKINEYLSYKNLNKSVFIIASVITLVSVVLTMIFPVKSGDWLWSLSLTISNKLGWYYMLAVGSYLIFMIYIAISRYGDIKLGPDHAKPDFPLLTWASMLFAAGIGIDLLFFGASEPLTHFLTAPGGRDVDLHNARVALTTTFLDWGIHGWGIYALIGMALAYFSYRKRQPLALRSALLPLIGKERVNGWIGRSVDTFGIVCTIFGISTSLGIGVLQANAGLTHMFGIATSTTTQILIIVSVILVAAISATTGVDKGVRRLSELNMGLAVILLIVLLTMGSTVFLLNALVQNIGDYFQTVITKTFDVYAYQGEIGNNWKASWTVFFWAWWIAWAPFVGMFIARISRGRTIREFTFGVLFIPLGFIFAWFSIFGNSAIDLYQSGVTEIGEVAVNDPAMGIFVLFEKYSMGTFWAMIAIILGLIFFVTSADSGALVLANLSTKDLTAEEDAPIWLRLFWAFAIGAVTLGLLFAGGFSSLQAVVVISGLPFSVVLILYMFAIHKSFREEKLRLKADNIDFTHSIGTNINWKDRLSRIVSYPPYEMVQEFVMSDVKKAMKIIAKEFAINGEKLTFTSTEQSVKLVAHHDGLIDFVYKVVLIQAKRPTFSVGLSDASRVVSSEYYKAEVFLRDGGKGYDIMGYSVEQIINDIINQYERHIHFLNEHSKNKDESKFTMVLKDLQKQIKKHLNN